MLDKPHSLCLLHPVTTNQMSSWNITTNHMKGRGHRDYSAMYQWNAVRSFFSPSWSEQTAHSKEYRSHHLSSLLWSKWSVWGKGMRDTALLQQPWQPCRYKTLLARGPTSTKNGRTELTLSSKHAVRKYAVNCVHTKHNKL